MEVFQFIGTVAVYVVAYWLLFAVLYKVLRWMCSSTSPSQGDPRQPQPADDPRDDTEFDDDWNPQW